jgi:hypothetical protein
MVDQDIVHLSKPTECTTQRVNPNVNCELQFNDMSILADHLCQVHHTNVR